MCAYIKERKMLSAVYIDAFAELKLIQITTNFKFLNNI